MPKTDHTGKRRVIRPLLCNGIAVAAAALVGVAFAAPARAEDPSTPAPLMLGTSVVIPPEEPQALPADVTPPVDPSSEVQPPEAQEIPAKSTRAERPDVPRLVISAMHSARANVTRDGQPHAVAGWYQVSPRQYRRLSDGVRSPRTMGHVRTAPSTVDSATPPKASAPQAVRMTRHIASHTCAEVCARDRRYNVPWNASHISTCIFALPSQPGRELLCERLLERMRSLLAARASSRAGGQYQQARTQYQSGDLDEVPTVAVTAYTAGWQLVGANTPEGTVESVERLSPARPTVAPVPGKPAVSDVRAAVAVHRIRGANGARMRARSTETAPRGPRSRAALVAHAPTTSSSSDWFVRTLLLLGAAGAALLLVAGAKVGGLDKGVAELGYRIGSRGLTPNRIALRNDAIDSRRPRGSGIRYRE